MLVVLAFISILAAVSVPSFLGMRTNFHQQESLELTELLLSQAYSEARSTNQTVRVIGAGSGLRLERERGEDTVEVLAGANTFASDFIVSFVPPFGDVLKSPRQIVLDNGKRKVGLKIHQKSGLITPVEIRDKKIDIKPVDIQVDPGRGGSSFLPAVK